MNILKSKSIILFLITVALLKSENFQTSYQYSDNKFDEIKNQDLGKQNRFFKIKKNNPIQKFNQPTIEIENINPQFGPMTGNTKISIRGSNFPLEAQIKIDGVDCKIIFIKATLISCITGPKLSVKSPSIKIMSKTKKILFSTKKIVYYYHENWSDPLTWKDHRVPKDGERVVIPKNKIIFIQESTNFLKQVLVEGVLIFADKKNLVINVESLMILGGELLMGTAQSPLVNSPLIVFNGANDTGWDFVCQKCKIQYYSTNDISKNFFHKLNNDKNLKKLSFQYRNWKNTNENLGIKTLKTHSKSMPDLTKRCYTNNCRIKLRGNPNDSTLLFQNSKSHVCEYRNNFQTNLIQKSTNFIKNKMMTARLLTENNGNEIEQRRRYWDVSDDWEGPFPTSNDDIVEIKKTWNMILNHDSPVLKHLRIWGRLSFDAKIVNVTLRAKLIEIMEGGELIIADWISEPFGEYQGLASIVLHGTESDDKIQIVPGFEVTKAIVNKGTLTIKGNTSRSNRQILTKSVKGGDSVIFVDSDDHNWNKGDELVISSSTSKADHSQKVMIKEAHGSMLTLVKSVDRFFYGSPEEHEINGKKTDIRARVILLSRPILIEGQMNGQGDTFGCAIINKGFTNEQNLPVQGKLNLSGVRIRNCGQPDSSLPAVQFSDMGNQSFVNYIENSSIYSVSDKAIQVSNYHFLSISFTNIFDATGSGIHIESSIKISLESNSIVQVKSPASQINGQHFNYGIYFKDLNSTLKQHNIMIKNNFVSSIESFGIGLHVPGFDCSITFDDPADHDFVGNIVRSCDIGWLAFGDSSQDCLQLVNFIGQKNRSFALAYRGEFQIVKIHEFELTYNKFAMLLNSDTANQSSTPSETRANDRISIAESLIAGATHPNEPLLTDIEGECEMNGIVLHSFQKNVSILQARSTQKLLAMVTDTESIFVKNIFFENVSFTNFESNESCLTKSTAFVVNMSSANNFVSIMSKNSEISLLEINKMMSMQKITVDASLNSILKLADCGDCRNQLVYQINKTLQSDCEQPLTSTCARISPNVFNLNYIFGALHSSSNINCDTLDSGSGWDCSRNSMLIYIKDAEWEIRDTAQDSVRLGITHSNFMQVDLDFRIGHKEFVWQLRKVTTEKAFAFEAPLAKKSYFLSPLNFETELTFVNMQFDRWVSMIIRRGNNEILRNWYQTQASAEFDSEADQCGSSFYFQESKILKVNLKHEQECAFKIHFAGGIFFSLKITDPTNSVFQEKNRVDFRRFIWTEITRKTDNNDSENSKNVNVVKFNNESKTIWFEILEIDDKNDFANSDHFKEAYCNLSHNIRRNNNLDDWRAKNELGQVLAFSNQTEESVLKYDCPERPLDKLCKEFGSTSDVCKTCLKNYELENSLCQLTCCEVWNPSLFACTKFKDDFFDNSDKCIRSVFIEGCQDYDKNISNVCINCQSNYELSDSKCRKSSNGSTWIWLLVSTGAVILIVVIVVLCLIKQKKWCFEPKKVKDKSLNNLSFNDVLEQINNLNPSQKQIKKVQPQQNGAEIGQNLETGQNNAEIVDKVLPDNLMKDPPFKMIPVDNSENVKRINAIDKVLGKSDDGEADVDFVQEIKDLEAQNIKLGGVNRFKIDRRSEGENSEKSRSQENDSNQSRKYDKKITVKNMCKPDKIEEEKQNFLVPSFIGAIENVIGKSLSKNSEYKPSEKNVENEENLKNQININELEKELAELENLSGIENIKEGKNK